MPTYLVETFLPDVRGHADDLRLLGHGTGVRYIRSIAIPDDDTSFHVIRGPSRDAVVRAMQLAGLAYDRISEASESRPHERRT